MLHDLIVSTAQAQDAAATDPSAVAPSPLSSFLPLIFIFVLFYFLLIRPQQKKFKAHQAMLEEIKSGDKIITGGGIHGKVTKVDGSVLSVEIASGIEIKVEKSTVSDVLGKPEAQTKVAKKS